MNNLSAIYVRRSSVPIPMLPSLAAANHQSASINRVYWIRKPEQMHRPHKVSTKILGLGIFMVGVVLLSIGLIIGLEFPVYVTDKIVKDQCMLDKDHAFYDKWVNDERWTRLNRLYYWTLENPEEFRLGARPRFVEKGPYVYREERQHVNVAFSGTRMSYQVKLKQTYADDVTRRECGENCMETDKLTVLNTELIQRLYHHDGWDKYIFNQVPKYVQNIIHQLEEITDETALYDYLGCLDDTCDNLTYQYAQQASCDSQNISFGNYLRRANNSRSIVVLTSLKNDVDRPTKFIFLKSIYQHLINSVFDMSDNTVECRQIKEGYTFYWKLEQSQNSTDTNEDTLAYNSTNSSSTNKFNIRVNLTSGCSLVSVVSVLYNHMIQFSELQSRNWSFSICSEDTNQREEIESDFDTILSYFMVLSDFLQIYLLQFLVSLLQSSPINSIYHTKSQRDLALGYTTSLSGCNDIVGNKMKGILQSHSSFEDVFYSSPKIVISTCLEQGNSDNNMIVREFNGSQFAPPGVYSDDSTQQFGFTSVLPPSDICRACASPYPNNYKFDIFIEDLHRSITFEEKAEHTTDGYRLFRYEISGSLSPSAPCNLINTTSVLLYPSFIGVPYYEGSGCPYLQAIGTGPSRNFYSYIRPLLEEQPTGPVCIYELVTIGPASKRIQVAFHWWTDGGPRLYNGAETDQLFDNWHFNSTYYALHLEFDVEPWTGRVWSQSIKLQTSTVISAHMKGVVTDSTINQINYIDIQLPLHWVDKTAVISEEEKDYFSYKIVRLMSVSCGGIIGLTTAALIIMGLSFFIGLLSSRKNRIEPIVENRRTSSIIHRPPYE